MDSQAVDDGASLSTLPLPVVNLSQEANEGFLGVGHVAVWRPAQELEMTHHQLAFLQLKNERKLWKKMRKVFNMLRFELILYAAHITTTFKCLSGYQPAGTLSTLQTCSGSAVGLPAQLVIGC